MAHPALEKRDSFRERKLKMKNISKIHLDSFNFIINEGLSKAYKSIDPVYTRTNPEIKIYIMDAIMEQNQNRQAYPFECKMRGETYSSNLKMKIVFEMDNGQQIFTERNFLIPLMVKSELCYLNGKTNEELRTFKEEDNPLALMQPKWKEKGEHFTEFGILIRSVKDEHSQSDVILHYLSNGSVELRLFYQRVPYNVSLMLLIKALVDETDYFLVKEITRCDKDEHLKQCILAMLRKYSDAGIHTHQQAKCFIGCAFSAVTNLMKEASPEYIADYIFKKSILIHLENNYEKFKLLCFVTRMLFYIIKGNCKPNEPDNPAFQEILSSGQIYLMTLKEEMASFLNSVGRGFSKHIIKKQEFKLSDLLDAAKRCTNRAYSLSCSMRSIIATGNVPLHNFRFASNSGFSILCDRRNILQFISHFTCINKFSMPFYTKTMRKFYPESWGFICPVETPEGHLTSLQNHLAKGCEIISPGTSQIETKILFELGMLSYHDILAYPGNAMYCVLLDGRAVGWLYFKFADKFVQKLKSCKRVLRSGIPDYTEIVFITSKKNQFLYPGIYIFSTPCRLMRSVKNINDGEYSSIGTFEQLYIKSSTADKVASHVELSSTNFLGLSASLIPFSEHNPAARNIFSCMKSKQAVGTPFKAFDLWGNTKTLQLIYPHSPMITTRTYDEFDLDEYPFGTNMTIAVISYSGYDMEDALVINKSSVERGLMHDMVHKTICFDLLTISKDLGFSNCANVMFQRDPSNVKMREYLDEDGLPYVGSRICEHDPICSILICESNTWHVEHYEGKQMATIKTVELFKNFQSCPERSLKLAVKICYKRVPEVGDKYANLHGQKGICSLLMNSEDMPFTSDGLIPDILFNPHGLPSRMTIGMILESLIGKIAAGKGQKYIHNSFQCSENNDDLVSFLGKELEKLGFDFYGTEKFYSGTSGNELEANIFCGVAFYERLYHVVEEKYQVCSVGNVDTMTGQPKKISKSGAIRFGEMERDSLLSHGAAFLILDRLHFNSDACKAWVCAGCNGLLYPILQSCSTEDTSYRNMENYLCQICDSSTNLI